MNKKTSKKNNPVVFISGSSKGIGLEIAKKLARKNFDIVLNGRTDSKHLKKAKEDILSKAKVNVLCLPFDISNISVHEVMVKKIIEKFGRIDCLINNAGISVDKRGDILDVTTESFDKLISSNLKSHFFLTQKIAEHMIKNDSKNFKSIINISSSNAQAASINRAEYCISKSALEMMGKLFAVRLAKEHINVYNILPGLIKTDMTKPVKKKYNKLLKKGFSPINRWGEPKDIAKAVSFIARGKMSFVTGESIHIDGGLLIPRY
ncbi:3-ketoacyl-ACP reductase [Poseidonibacter sp.]|uniref:3-ketoacyl-ACP reductase n=1 Tax=Poseidonibacter sp. TaxID=2321188 RepID=UPI003C70B92F